MNSGACLTIIQFILRWPEDGIITDHSQQVIVGCLLLNQQLRQTQQGSNVYWQSAQPVAVMVSLHHWQAANATLH
ncbi:hypothetical protein H0A66_12140 [Alcaligenaceae bacterium]|nr:hypothetical protein [Alcaligenaceae bacterium]